MTGLNPEPQRRTPEDVPERFPPDAPIVPNDQWMPDDPPPRYCGRLGWLLRRRHYWVRLDPGLPRLTCARCDAPRYIVPSAKW